MAKRLQKNEFAVTYVPPFEERYPFKWYTIACGSAAEARVALQLQRYCQMLGWGHLYDTYLIPLENVMATKSDGERVVKRERLFAGYLLARLRLTTDLKNLILSMSGVSSILGDREGTKALPVSDRKVAQIIEAMIEAEGDGTKVRRTARFKVGSEVVINYGHFQNFMGTVLEHTGEKVTLNISIFGRMTKASFHESTVTPTNVQALQA